MLSFLFLPFSFESKCITFSKSTLQVQSLEVFFLLIFQIISIFLTPILSISKVVLKIPSEFLKIVIYSFSASRYIAITVKEIKLNDFKEHRLIYLPFTSIFFILYHFWNFRASNTNKKSQLFKLAFFVVS